MKELILDYSRWRCGGQGSNRLGEGDTLMLNEEGFSCCLGQFAPQLNSDITNEYILGLATPSIVSHKMGMVIPTLNTEYSKGTYISTDLSTKAITINDNEFTIPEEKIRLLQELFGRKEYSIRVINKPE
jgi:hypothetical protein